MISGGKGVAHVEPPLGSLPHGLGTGAGTAPTEEYPVEDQGFGQTEVPTGHTRF